MSKEIRVYSFSENDNKEFVDVIVSNTAKLGAAAAYKKYGRYGIIEKVEVEDYDKLNSEVKESILAFAAKKAGFDTPKNSTELAFAFDNKVFMTIVNTINARSVALMMVKYDCPQIEAFADIETVGVGDSRTYEIDTKGLPQAQKATYESNVALVPSYAKGAVTVTPKPYVIGTSLDYIRIIGNDYDWGAEIARVYAGMLFAQYKLGVSKIFDSSILTGTPLYQTAFASNTYTQLADDIGMLNGGTGDSVTAYGTRVAFNAISALATQGGFSTKDRYIENGYLQKIFGVDSVILEQFTNYAAPFTTATATNLRAIPNDAIVLISNGTDKPVKIVRENYIRVIETDAKDNTANRMEYTFFQNFDAAIATASHFGLQATAS